MKKYEREFDWSRLMQEGFIVQLHVSFFRGSRKLTPEELGLTEAIEDEEVRKVLSLGRKRIAPLWYTKKARSIESVCRVMLDSYSLASPFGKFVPKAAWDILAPRLAEYETRFNSLTEKLFDRWEEEKRLVLRQFEVAFQRLGVPDEAIGAALEKIEDLYPTMEEVKQATRWDVFAYRIALPEAPEARDSTAEAVELAYRARLDAALVETIEGFAGQLRSSLAAWAEKVAKSVANAKEIPVNSLESMRKHLRRFRALDVAGDDEVRELLDAMAKLVEGGPVGTKMSDEAFAAKVSKAAQKIVRAAEKDLDPTKLRLAAVACRGTDVAAVKEEASEMLMQVAARMAKAARG